MIPSSKQRRQSSRWHCSGEAEIVFSMYLPTMRARIADLSVEGCLLIAKQPLELHTNTQVELTFTINQLPFRVRALVKAIRSESVYGFQFPLLSSRSQRRLEELVEELEENNRDRARGFKRPKQGVELSRNHLSS